MEVFLTVDMRIGDTEQNFWEQGLASARVLWLLYAASATLCGAEVKWASEILLGRSRVLDGCWMRAGGGRVSMRSNAVYNTP